MHDRQALGLGERHDQRLLPVGHEAGVYIGFDGHRVQVAARVPETDALVRDVEFATDLAEYVEEGHHLRLGGALDEDVAVGGKRGGRPAGGFDAVGQRGVRVALELLDAFDAEGAVHIHGDDGAHLLQHGHEVHDLRLGGGAGQFGLALSQHGGQQGLLGGADRRVRQMNLRSLQAVRRGDVDAVGVVLVHIGTELAQGFQMEVDGTAADVATAERRDERLAEAMQQRSGKEDRDAGGAGEGVDVSHGRHLDMGGVDGHDALVAVDVHVHAVQAQQVGYDVHVADLRHVLEHRGARREQRGHHGLADEILPATHFDGAVQRLASLNVQDVFLVLGHGQPLFTKTHCIPVCHNACGDAVKCARSGNALRRTVPFGGILPAPYGADGVEQRIGPGATATSRRKMRNH